MNPFIRFLASAVIQGASVAGKAFMQAYQQAVINAKQSGGAKKAAENMSKSFGRSKMSSEEAKAILNLKDVENLPKAEIDKVFKQVFDSNDVSRGGSFYIQSKVYRARERILMDRGEFDENNDQLEDLDKSTEPNDKSSTPKDKKEPEEPKS